MSKEKKKFPLFDDPDWVEGDATNEDRARWADAAIRAFREENRCDEEDAIGDLVADLMHWADRKGYLFCERADHGADLYSQETAGQGHQRLTLPFYKQCLQQAEKALDAGDPAKAMIILSTAAETCSDQTVIKQIQNAWNESDSGSPERAMHIIEFLLL